MQSVRNLKNFVANPVHFLDEEFDNSPHFSGVKKVHIGPKRFVLVYDAVMANEILTQKSKIYQQNRSIFERITPITGQNGLVQLNGEASRQARKKAFQMFSSSAMERSAGIVSCVADDVIRSTTGLVDPSELMTELVLNTAFEIFLGLRLDEETRKVARQFLRLNQLCGKRMLSPMPLPMFLPTPSHREIKDLQLRLRQEVQRLITESSDHHQSTIPQIFKDSPDMIDHCLTFLFAGHETTAASLAFTLHLLGRTPEYQPIVAKSEEMALAVYKESLRLFSPAYMLVREAVASDDLNGVKVRSGDQVIIALQQLHRNPRHFVHPEKFQPERFLKDPLPVAFLPFGRGGKSCVGERLAYMEAKIVLQRFCQSYQIHSVSNEPIMAQPLVTLHPQKGQLMELKNRATERQVDVALEVNS